MGVGVVAAQLARLGGALTTSDHASVVSINLFVALLCACIVLGHLLEENRWLNESITALIIGLCTGVVILLTTKGKSSHVLVFSEDLFFIYLLPPIIFNAGFQVKKKQFFRNFMTITLFGAVGTMISFFTISLSAIAIFSRMNIGTLDVGDFLAIGAIFSATDSVCTLQVLNQDETPFLYSLVFGEGVVNDATSVVLFNALQNFDLNHVDALVILKFLGNFLYLFVSSTFLGVFSGLLSAYIIKKLYIGRHSTDREVALMMLMAYLSYMLAELLDLSGILTVFFCGIVMSHYTWHNVTESSRVTTKHAFATLSFIAETFLFLYVGMDALDIEKWKFASDSPGKSIGVSSILLGLVLVGRAAFVFPLSFLSNLTKKTPAEKISWRQQIVIWWAGLMRGAVSIALAYNKFTRSGHTQLHGNAIMITSTITVVLFSTMPGPRDAPMKCFIRRNRGTQTYYLYIGLTDALTDDGKFLLAARKFHRPTCTEYLISLDQSDTSKGSHACIGKLRSNFLRTKFTVYDAHSPHAGAVVSKRWSAGNYPVSHVYYELNVLGSRGPRRMRCVMDSIPVSAIEQNGTAPTQTGFPLSNENSSVSIPFFKSKSSRMDSFPAPLSTQDQEGSKLVLKNKSPRWHEHLQCWCLNFHGRVTVASVKNFQLVATDESAPTNQEHEDTTLQFGKIGKDLFTMDYRYPVSAFQAFAICLSSFDTKLACE